jgi:magnesium transporter
MENDQKYILNELDVIIWDNFIVTTTSLESQSFNDLCESIKEEAKDISEPYKTSPYYILYRIIDIFYDKTIKSLSISSKKLLTIQDNLADRKIEKSLVEDLMNEDLNKIFIKHNFLSQDIVIMELIAHINWLHDKHLNMYFNSLKVKLHKIINTINVLSERIDSLMWAYDTFVGIKNNDTITRLTFVNAIFMPLTLIAGIWWMSERSMMTGPNNWRLAYPIFLGLCLVIAYVTFFLLRRYFLKK